MREAMLWVFLGCVAAGCGDLQDERCTAGEACEFRGGPSGVVCGTRWSYDHVSFACDAGWVSPADLGRFRDLRHLRLTDTVFVPSGAAYPGVANLNLGGFTAHALRGRLLAATFPKIESLIVRDAPADFALSALPALKDLFFVRTTAPSVVDLAAVPTLEAVFFDHLRCGQCAEELAAALLARRPDLEVSVNGKPVEAAKAAAPE